LLCSDYLTQLIEGSLRVGGRSSTCAPTNTRTKPQESPNAKHDQVAAADMHSDHREPAPRDRRSPL